MKKDLTAKDKKTMRVKTFQIKKGSETYQSLTELCTIATKIYNNALFVIRHLYFASNPKNHDAQYYIDRLPPHFKKYLTSKTKNGFTTYSLTVPSKSHIGSYYTAEKAMYYIFEHQEDVGDYGKCQNMAARNAVKLAFKAYKGYVSLIKKYFDGSLEYRPSLPRYRKDQDLMPFIVDSFRRTKHDTIIVNGTVCIKNAYIGNITGKIKQVRIVPMPSQNIYNVEVVYEKDITKCECGTNTLAIDIGINNLCAVTTNFGDAFLVNGKPLKNINQHYNNLVGKISRTYSHLNVKTGKKRKIYERKRNNQIDTYMHQASRWIADYAKDNGIGIIYIGHNKGWKDSVNLGRENNRTFVQIPFAKLIQRIKYKAEEYGIQVEEINEAYTSKCSAIDSEPICKHTTYKGKRGGRHNKEFVSEKGKLINADINGSLNILRLGNGKDIRSIQKSVFNPTKVKNIGSVRYDMKPQNHIQNGYDMFSSCQVIGIPIKVEATVDSHYDESASYKKASSF